LKVDRAARTPTEIPTPEYFHRSIPPHLRWPRIGRVEVVECGLEVDDDPRARSVGQVEDLVDLLTVGDDPFVGADGLCQLDRVGAGAAPIMRGQPSDASKLDR